MSNLFHIPISLSNDNETKKKDSTINRRLKKYILSRVFQD